MTFVALKEQKEVVLKLYFLHDVFFKINGCACDKMSQDFGRYILEGQAHDWNFFSHMA